MIQETKLAMISGIFLVIAALISVFRVEINLAFKKKKSLKSLEEAMRFNSEIDVKLRAILAQFNASRIWIMQFHNGGNFYPTGKSIQKLSMIYEAVAEDVNSVQIQYQNVPISLFSYSLNKMLDEDVFVIEDKKSFVENRQYLKSILFLDTEKVMACFSLKDLNGTFVGVLGLSFNEKDTITKEVTAELQHYSYTIAAFLTRFLENNKH